MSLLQTAREASGSIHGQIERTPLAASLVGGNVDRETYARLMAGLVRIHEAVEERFDAPLLKPLDQPSLRRLEAARSDRNFLATAQEDSVDLRVVDEWEQSLETHSSESDWVWVGALYVLEGSRMGSRMLLLPIATALGVNTQPGRGVDYHLAAVGDGGVSWRSYKAFLESAAPSDIEREAFADGVRKTFQMMHDLYEELSACEVV
jgi:heme oxygenase